MKNSGQIESRLRTASQIENRVWWKVSVQVEDQVWDQVWRQVGFQVEEQLHEDSKYN
jgi:hypothetical protein